MSLRAHLLVGAAAAALVASSAGAQSPGNVAPGATAAGERPAPRRPALPAPPAAPVRLAADTLHGVVLPDPYRYFEDAADPTARAWIEAQGAYTRRVLDSLPGRRAQFARLETLDAQDSVSVPTVVRAGERHFSLRRARGEPRARLFVRDGLDGPDRLLVDPVAHRAAGDTTSVAIEEVLPTPDGRRVAYTISSAGAEFPRLYVRDVATGRLLPDSLVDRGVYLSAFSADGATLFYLRLNVDAERALSAERWRLIRVYRHRLGTPVADDRPLLGADVPGRVPVDSTHFPWIALTPASPLAVAGVNQGVSRVSAYAVAPARTVVEGASGADIPWRPVGTARDSVADVVPHGRDLYVLAFGGTPNGRLLRVRADTGSGPLDLGRAETVLAEGALAIESVRNASDALYVTVARPVGLQVLRIPHGTEGAPRIDTLPLPGPGASVSAVATDPAAPGAILEMSSWTAPTHRVAWLPVERRAVATSLGRPPRPAADSAYVAEEVLVGSHDGVRVPLSLSHRRGLARDGRAPVLLMGYGAYGSRGDPGFGAISEAWLERGGVVAECHVRGGGAYGLEWHRGGKEATKPNTWRDFIACAEWLVRQGYTTPARLGAAGGSAGGILVGRAVQERPDLFAAAVALVPSADLVRFELVAPGGPSNAEEFGSVRTAAGLAAVVEQSAYRHVRDGAPHPALLITAGANDPRVPAWVPAKLAARWQAASPPDGPPILLRYDAAAGHGLGDDRPVTLAMWADVYAFLLWQFGDPDFQPVTP